MPLRATIDREAEMSYIYLAERAAGDICRTIELDNINLDINQDGKILGIEIYGVIDVEDITSRGFEIILD